MQNGYSLLSGVESRVSLIKLCNRKSWLTFVYTQSKSCDHSLDKTSFDFSNIFRAMQSSDMSGKSSIILKLPRSVLT